MELKTIQRILGLLLALFSLTMAPPITVSLIYGDGMLRAFVTAFALILAAGLLLWFPVRAHRRELRVRDGFLVVVAFWVTLGLSGAVPLLLANVPQATLTNAVFESISGLTTTGATVFTGIELLPESIRFYRQMLQWLGGMGIIVLAVAILPVLGIGGMQLYRAETPGPMKDDKLTPRITETAKALWYIYLLLTVLCALGYWLFGMSPFDAIGHSFSTVSIGGFSTYDTSLAHFDNAGIEMVAMVFMVISGINFALHFTAWRSRGWQPYARDSECRTYLKLLLLVALITTAHLYLSGTYDNILEALRNGFFQTISISTTTGFTTDRFDAWPGILPLLLLFASFVGGCAGSTGGGLKVIRVILLVKQGLREITRLIHPSAEVPIKVGGSTMSPRVVDAVWGFFATYVATFGLVLLALIGTGLDQVTAFSATVASMNNMGPGLGEVAGHYAEVSDAAKWILCVAMLLGRLEIFTFLVILSPAFWRG